MAEDTARMKPESGFLLRLRTWRDAFPWLAIGDALKPATSVLHLALVSFAVLISWSLQELPTIFESDVVLDPSTLAEADLPITWFEVLMRPWGIAADCVVGPARTLLSGHHSFLKAIFLIVEQIILLGVWAIIGGQLIRQAGLAIAGRSPMSLVAGHRFALGRALSALATPLIPIIVVVAVATYFAFAAVLGRIPGIGIFLELLFQTLGIPLALIAGLIGFGAFLAIPLSWSAIFIEEDGSCFDGISRGYEYVLRRPLQLFAYLLLAMITISLLSLLAAGVIQIGTSVAVWGMSWVERNPRSSGLYFTNILNHGVTVAILIQAWCLQGWLYLLLRRSANYQELEDVWEVPIANPTVLPPLNIDR